MMKFFRKYNKQLLALFMVLLMVVFIGGSALQSLMDPKIDFQVAKCNFGPISSLEVNVANEATKLMESLQLDWRQRFAGAPSPLETMDWLLLSREADSLGWSPDESSALAAGGDDSLAAKIDQMARAMRVKPVAIRRAMAEYRAVQEAAGAIASAATPSQAEVDSAARDALEQVRIRAAVLPADAFAEPGRNFSEDELKSHFETFRGKERGVGLNFGYYRHPAIKVQYLRIDRDAVAEKLGVANLEKTARTFYDENKTTHAAFRRNPAEMPAPDLAGQGDVPGPPSPAVSPYLAWEQAKPVAMNAVRKKLADEAADQLANFMIQLAAQDWVDSERKEDGYRAPPTGASDLGLYEQLLKRLPPKLTFPDAVSVASTEFFTAETADKVPDLGGASFRPAQGVGILFKTLAFKTQVIVPTVPKDEGTNAGDYLATFQTCSYPIRASDAGNVFIFRIIDSRPGHAADSLDEVRAEVIADLRTLHGFEAAKRRAASLKECMASDTLKNACDADGELETFRAKGVGLAAGYLEPPPFSRVPKFLAARGRSPDGIDVGGGLGKLPSAAVEQCFSVANANDKTAIIEVPDRAMVVLVEWVETIHAAEDEFTKLRTNLSTQMVDLRMRSALAEWFDPEKVRARTGFAFQKSK